jgi:hypothetical protein
VGERAGVLHGLLEASLGTLLTREVRIALFFHLFLGVLAILCDLVTWSARLRALLHCFPAARERVARIAQVVGHLSAMLAEACARFSGSLFR